MISEALRRAFTAIAPNRSHDSWIAGSCVLAGLIDRVPNDVDIHHVSMMAFTKAFDDDIHAMVAANFTLISLQESASEWEAVLMHSSGTLTMNWVLEPKRPLVIIDDPLMGFRAGISDVVTRKIGMARNDRLQKHRSDLYALLSQVTKITDELDPRQLALALFDLDSKLWHMDIVKLPSHLELELFRALVTDITGFKDIEKRLVEENLSIVRREKESVGDLNRLLCFYGEVRARNHAPMGDAEFAQLLRDVGLLETAQQIIYLFFLGAIRSNGAWKRCGWHQHQAALVWAAMGIHAPMTRGAGEYGDWAFDPGQANQIEEADGGRP